MFYKECKLYVCSIWDLSPIYTVFYNNAELKLISFSIYSLEDHLSFLKKNSRSIDKL